MSKHIPEGAGRYKDDFEHFLQEIHGAQYIGTDDCMPDDFNDWLNDLSPDYWIEYGDKFAKRKFAELLKQIPKKQTPKCNSYSLIICRGYNQYRKELIKIIDEVITKSK